MTDQVPELEKTEPVVLRDIKYHAAVLQSDGDFAVETFDTLPQLVTRLTELIDHDVSVFSFVGTHMRVSKPPFRHLLSPWGPKPLFALPVADLEPDDTGYLGVDPIHLERPPEIKTNEPMDVGDQPDEFFSADNVLNVFDSVLPDPDN